MKKRIALIIATVLISGVFTDTGFAKKKKPDLQMKTKYRGSLSSEYFGFIGFTIKNNTAEWKHVTKVDIEFPDPAHNDIVQIVAGKQLKAWNEAINQKKALQDFWWSAALGGIAAIGGIAAGTSKNRDVQRAGGIASALSVGSFGVRELGKIRDSLSFADVLPDTHLLGGDFYIPPQMSAQKWVLFYTKHTEDSPMLSKAKFTLTTENEKYDFDETFFVNAEGKMPKAWQKMIWKKQN